MAILRAELLKWKRSWVLWATLLAAGVAPAFNGLLFWGAKRVARMAGEGVPIPWEGFFAQVAFFANLLVYPLLFGFVVTYAVAREYQEAAATNLFALPASRTGILLAKLGAAALILTVAVVAAVPLAVVAGLPVLGHLPSWGDVAAGLKAHLVSGLAQFLLVPVVLWLAVLGRNYVLPLAAAGFFVVANIFTAFAGDEALRIPTAIPAWTAQARYLPEIASHLPAWWIQLPPLFLVFLALAALTVSLRDVV